MCVPAALEVAFSVCPSLMLDLDVMHTKELEEGAAPSPLEHTFPPLVPPDLSSSTDHCVTH